MLGCNGSCYAFVLVNSSKIVINFVVINFVVINFVVINFVVYTHTQQFIKIVQDWLSAHQNC
jgi:hypothetical protein